MFYIYHALKAQVQIEGNVNIGNLSVQNFGSHNFGFMYQHDLFCGVLTVKEHLYFMVSFAWSSEYPGFYLKG